MKATPSLPELPLGARRRGEALYAWLRRAIGEAILSGAVRPGTRLPSSRALAAQHAVSRGTVVSVFEQLVAEGYLESRVGSGSVVRRVLPDRAPARQRRDALPPVRAVRLSARGRALASSPFPLAAETGPARLFQSNTPALDRFPTTLWSRLAGRRLRSSSRELLARGAALGYLPLREAIARYLGAARGIACTAEEILITTGSQQAIDLLGRILLDPKAPVWMEDPGYSGAIALLRALEAEIVPVPVDEEGIRVSEGRRLCRQARLAYVTPAHQAPTGVVLSAGRRLELLQWAREAGAWVLEDDYDGEFRFSGRPLGALRSLDASGSVLYASSFSKVMFPTLRLGYVVLPPSLAEPVARARSLIERYPPVLDQAILCDFIEGGHFGQHVRRMRLLYEERLAALRAAARSDLPGLLTLAPVSAGLQTVGWLPAGYDDVAISRACRQAGLEVAPVSIRGISKPAAPGLILGFAANEPRQLRAGVASLARILRARGA